MMENFPNLVKEMDINPQEAQRIPKNRDQKRPIPRNIIIKMSKIKYKERIFKAAREKQIITYKGTPIRLAADFSKETMQDRRAWHKIFDRMKTQDLQPRIIYSAKLSFRVEGQIKSFPDKNKLKEFIITKPVLQEMLERLL
uniref:LINE1 type transposase domain containing 1 n=1 Tax=Rousettus aegyptiacus TaxID=9407 RepID=A0A7J8C2G8_ROUAE|nr:hypothetical protein HJG63_009362 [Rousettus aegyptiacus]